MTFSMWQNVMANITDLQDVSVLRILVLKREFYAGYNYYLLLLVGKRNLQHGEQIN